MSDIPPLPPSDFKYWPKTADAAEEISVAFEVIASALVAMTYDLRQIRLMLAESPGLGLGEPARQPPAPKSPLTSSNARLSPASQIPVLMLWTAPIAGIYVPQCGVV